MQAIPVRGFVSVNYGAGVDTAFQRRERTGFGLEHERKRAAVALASDDHNAALAVLIDRKRRSRRFSL